MSVTLLARYNELKQMEFSSRFRGFLPVVLDLETAGLNPNRHSLLEMAVVTLDWQNDTLSCKESHTWSIIPHRATEIDSKSLAFTNIDPYDPEREAADEESCIRECFRLVRKAVKESGCQRAVLTGHNAHFDRQFLKTAQSRNAIGRDPFHPFTVFDTASLAVLTYGHSVLRIACERAGIEFDPDQAHNAHYDARVTARLFCEIVNSSNYKNQWEPVDSPKNL